MIDVHQSFISLQILCILEVSRTAGRVEVYPLPSQPNRIVVTVPWPVGFPSTGSSLGRGSVHRHHLGLADLSEEEAGATVAVALPAGTGELAVHHRVPAATEQLRVHRPEGVERDADLPLAPEEAVVAEVALGERRGAAVGRSRADVDIDRTDVAGVADEASDAGGVLREAVARADVRRDPAAAADRQLPAREHLGGVHRRQVGSRQRGRADDHLAEAAVETEALDGEGLGVLGVALDDGVHVHHRCGGLRDRDVHDRRGDVDHDRLRELPAQERDLLLQLRDPGVRNGGGGGDDHGLGRGGRGGLGLGLRGRLRLGGRGGGHDGRARGRSARLAGGELGLEGLQGDALPHELRLDQRGVEGGASVGGVGGGGEGKDEGDEHRVSPLRLSDRVSAGLADLLGAFRALQKFGVDRMLEGALRTPNYWRTETASKPYLFSVESFYQGQTIIPRNSQKVKY